MPKRIHSTNAERQRAYRVRNQDGPTAATTEAAFVELARHCIKSGDPALAAFAGNLAVFARLEIVCGWECWKNVGPVKGQDLTGKMFGNLLAHERFTQGVDRSWIWLCENLTTGEAELWRTSDLTRIVRRGQRINRFSFSFNFSADLNCVAAMRAKLMPAARKRLARIKVARAAGGK